MEVNGVHLNLSNTYTQIYHAGKGLTLNLAGLAEGLCTVIWNFGGGRNETKLSFLSTLQYNLILHI